MTMRQSQGGKRPSVVCSSSSTSLQNQCGHSSSNSSSSSSLAGQAMSRAETGFEPSDSDDEFIPFSHGPTVSRFGPISRGVLRSIMRHVAGIQVSCRESLDLTRPALSHSLTSTLKSHCVGIYLCRALRRWDGRWTERSRLLVSIPRCRPRYLRQTTKKIGCGWKNLSEIWHWCHAVANLLETVRRLMRRPPAC